VPWFPETFSNPWDQKNHIQWHNPAHNFGIFKAQHGAHKLVLYIKRQAGGNAVRIDFMGIQPFRFDKNLMGIPVGETDDFIFNRRTITRPDTFNNPRIQWRSIQAGTDNIVGFTVSAVIWQGICFGCCSRLPRKENTGTGIIAVLFFQFTEINGSAINPRRRSGF